MKKSVVKHYSTVLLHMNWQVIGDNILQTVQARYIVITEDNRK